MFDIKPIYQDPVSALLTAGGTAYQIDESKAARRDDKRAQELETKVQNTKAARERRRLVREARKARAEQSVASIASGTNSSSSAITGNADIGQQLASSLSFLDTVTEANNSIGIFRQKAASHRGRAQDIAAGTKAAVQVNEFIGGGNAIKSLFGGG